MRFVDEFRDADKARALAAKIAALCEPGRRYKLMEVCGGHTHTIYKHGLEDYLPEAIQHFARAAQLDASLGEAYLDLGRSLLDSDRESEAVAPLETAVKLKPADPDTHFFLATAYQRTGRAADAAREFALHKSILAKLHPSGDANAPAPESPQQ